MTGKGAPTRRGKKPNPLLDPPVLMTAVMLLLVLELVLWAAVGPIWFIVVNAVAVAVVFAAMLAWRRRGKGGLLDRLLGASRKPGTSGRSGTSPKGASARKPGGKSRNPLSRLLNPKGASRPRGDASGGKKPGLFDALRGKRPGASQKPGASGDASGSPRQKKSKLWPFGSKGGPGKSGASKPARDASRSSGSPGGGGGSKKPDRKKKPGGLWDDIRQGFNDKRSESDGRKPKDRKDTPTPEPDQSTPDPAPKQAKTTQRRDPAPQPQEETMVRHEDDASLQRWGRNLKTVGPAIDELATTARQQGDVIEAIALGVKKLAEQGENDLPAHRTLTAEAEAIASELRKIHAEEEERADRLRSLSARSEALATRYGSQHETDEARLAGERGGRAREKRADVGKAEQDT